MNGASTKSEVAAEVTRLQLDRASLASGLNGAS